MEMFLFGAGYSARALARLPGELSRFAGTTRDAGNFVRMRQLGIEPFLFDGHALNGQIRARLEQATHLLISIPPEEAGDPVLKLLANRLLPDLEWIGYFSTTGVYGDHGGSWVDEHTPCNPMTQRSRNRLESERAWMRFGEEIGVPVAVLRLAGIYGPGRNAFVQIERGSAKRIVKPGHVFNRIHVEDIARALGHLARERRGGIFNLADDEPSPPQDVILFAAQLMGVAPPPEIPFAEAVLSPMQQSFYSESKRVSNALIKESGFRLEHGNYRDGLESLWTGGAWRSE